MVADGTLRQFMKSKIYKARLKTRHSANLIVIISSKNLEDGNAINRSKQMFKASNFFVKSDLLENGVFIVRSCA